MTIDWAKKIGRQSREANRRDGKRQGKMEGGCTMMIPVRCSLARHQKNTVASESL